MAFTDQRSLPPILHMTTVHWPLDGRIYFKEVRSLLAAGYDVELATTVTARTNHDGVTMLPLGSSDGPRWRRIIRDIRASFLMFQKPQAIIHIHDPELLISAFLPALCGRKLVYDVHEFYHERIPDSTWIPQPLRKPIGRLYDVVERAVLRRFAGVVIVSEEMRDRYRGLVGDERVALVRNFPFISHQEVMQARSSEHPVDGRPFILHTGGASRLRAFHVMVAAAEYLRAHGCDWPVINLRPVDLSGYERDTQAELLRRAADADVRNLGWVSQTEAWRYVAHAAIGFMPLSVVQNNVRGMPNKLFEYLLFGLPVVATDIGRTAEIVLQSQAGMVVTPEDGEAAGRALAQIASDTALRERFSANATRAGSMLSFSNEFEKLVLLYERIAADSPSLPRSPASRPKTGNGQPDAIAAQEGDKIEQVRPR